ncbi:HAD superfamily hydrolase, 5'-nucleotidase [Oesophagostomum dentatum]|uniref:HAD superfamily hydrolase, 5'-nucleotidase n=1 Tax=Oesophagostomum dentatum TaxID=61180 RepID=A0A0B1T0Q8_OESDE|nr:HAD superfamily hydrolase, 5'-nucleotidase [Oesophagostomum dentatum]
MNDRQIPQLIDLFSLPWAGLLSNVVHYCDYNNIAFDPKCLFDDLKECVQQVHTSGEMYRKVAENLEAYIHRNDGLREYLEMLRSSGKELFVVTNSPFTFINVGMTYMLGEDWRKYFKYIVFSAKKPAFFHVHEPFRNVGMTYMLGEDWRKYFKYIVFSAKKPAFFHVHEPFRLYDPVHDVVSFVKVVRLEEGQIYCRGNIEDLSTRAGFKGKGVLYFGDHIYTDLAEPILRLGWRTAAIVPELAREIRIQNDDLYRKNIQWLEMLTAIIEAYQSGANQDPEAANIINGWRDERSRLRENVKSLFNPQFGSLFRTFHNMTHFSRRMNRLSDVYTSRVPNMLKYDLKHCFFPRRNALPHENLHSVPVNTDCILDLVKQREELRRGLNNKV